MQQETEMQLLDFLENKIIYSDMEEIKSREESWDWLRGKNLLITGAYGMLASYVVYFLIYLNEKHNYGITIIAQGRNNEKMFTRFGIYTKRRYFRITNMDICRGISLAIKADYIIHAASLASSQYYASSPVDVLKPNSLGTFYLLEYAHRCKCESFLFFSSCDVYGKFSENRVYTEKDFGSMDPMELRNCYGESKRMGENMCISWYKQYGVPAKSVRIAHTYGPTMDIHNDVRVFSEFVRNALDGQDIIMKSDGSAVRPFCYISDAVSGFFKVLRYGDDGEAYTLLNDKAWLSIRELADIVAKCDETHPVKVIFQKRNNEDGYVESFVKLPPKYSVEKIKKLGWEAEVTVKDGFKRVIDGIVQ